MRDQRWISEVVRPSITTAMEKIVELAGEVNKKFGFNIKAGNQLCYCVLSSNWVSMVVQWRQSITNSLFDEHGQNCGLRVVEFSGGVVIPGENIWFPETAIILNERQYKPDVSRGRGFVLKEPGIHSSHPTSFQIESSEAS
jgi:hypothetical protein